MKMIKNIYLLLCLNIPNVNSSGWISSFFGASQQPTTEKLSIEKRPTNNSLPKSGIISTNTDVLNTNKTMSIMTKIETKIPTVFKIPEVHTTNNLWKNELTNMFLLCLPSAQFNDENVRGKMLSFIEKAKGSDKVFFCFSDNKKNENNSNLVKEVFGFAKKIKAPKVYFYSENSELYSLNEKISKTTFDAALDNKNNNIYSNI